MQLTEEQFVADWKKHMGLFHPICTASVVRYLNLRAQADAGPVGDESQMPRVHGVSRIADNPCSVLVMLMAEPSDDALREIHDRLRAQSGQRAGVAKGWKLVPVEPTDEMVRAGNDLPRYATPARHVWEAMLAAAPTQQQEGGS